MGCSQKHVVPPSKRMFFPVEPLRQIERMPVFHNAHCRVAIELGLPALQRSDRHTIIVVQIVRQLRLLNRAFKVFAALADFLLAERDPCKISG